jgi:hypothetical protein
MRWIWFTPLVLWLADSSLRAYQWNVGVEFVRMPENFVALFAMWSGTWVIESFSYRRWLLALA